MVSPATKHLDTSSRPIWLFDVDGTLTPPGRGINSKFEEWLRRFAEDNDVRIVSGGNFERIRGQLGEPLTQRLTRAYCCLGNSTWERGEEVSVSRHAYSLELIEATHTFARSSQFGKATGSTVVSKPGIVTIVPCGVDASPKEAFDYFLWDELAGERKYIAEQLIQMFPDICAVVSGRSSIDIVANGLDKSQVAQDLVNPVYFFGDSTLPGGNDATLAKKINQRTDGSRTIAVCDWTQTQRTLLLMSPPILGRPESLYQSAVDYELNLAFY
jgi:hydroxymethylpyrimidine pyrophosphatase-like HAD family hydrolase